MSQMLQYAQRMPQLAGPHMRAMLAGSAQPIPARQIYAMPAQQPMNISPSLADGFLGEDAGAVQAMPSDAFGLPPQDLINSLYDIFGSYPRKNVLPYAFSWSLLSSTGNALTPLGTQLPSIKITADAAHIATLITGASTGEYSILMRTDSSDRQLMQYPIHSATCVGTAERPFTLPKALLLAPNTTLSFNIVDLSNATNEVWFTLWGFKVYRRQYAAAG
jgi:hypothetical protein